MNLKQIACTLVLAAPLLAQDPLQAKLDKKLAKGFVTKIEWVQDYAGAKKSAASSGHLVLAYFTRSYAP